jgi:PPOX class probable F420-dependent enzyme
MAEQMTDEERRCFLSEGTRTAKLATVRADGRPHVVPVWFVLDGDDIVFQTGRDTVKGRNIQRAGRVMLCVDDERPPYSYVSVDGQATAADNPPEALAWATRIAARYMGTDLAEAYGRRNAVPGELLVRVTPIKTIATRAVAD